MRQNNRYDYIDIDEEKSAKWLKRVDLNIVTYENNFDGFTRKKCVNEINSGNFYADDYYMMHLKTLLFESEPSSSIKEGYNDGDENGDEKDPQYMMFLNNLSENGPSYKLEFATKNRIVSVIYEGEDDSDNECGVQSKFKKAHSKSDQNIGNCNGKVTDNVVEETNSKLKVVKYKESRPSRYEIGTRRSPRICNNFKDSTQKSRNITKRGTPSVFEGDPKSRAAKDFNNISRIMEVETRKSPISVGKQVEYTKINMENNRGREKSKLLEEKDLMSKGGKFTKPKTVKTRSKTFDDSYRAFVAPAKFEGKNLVTREIFDFEYSSDSEVLIVTNNALEFSKGGLNPFQTTEQFLELENEQLCLVKGDNDSVYRKKLMAKLGEPYDEREYKKLWNEINLEKQKVENEDLSESGVIKKNKRGEVCPSYLATYPPLKRKIKAAGHDRRKKLKYLRGFFFWLQNVVHEDAFQPWLDKSCLEVIKNNC